MILSSKIIIIIILEITLCFGIWYYSNWTSWVIFHYLTGNLKQQASTNAAYRPTQWRDLLIASMNRRNVSAFSDGHLTVVSRHENQPLRTAPGLDLISCILYNISMKVTLTVRTSSILAKEIIYSEVLYLCENVWLHKYTVNINGDIILTLQGSKT